CCCVEAGDDAAGVCRSDRRALAASAARIALSRSSRSEVVRFDSALRRTPVAAFRIAVVALLDHVAVDAIIPIVLADLYVHLERGLHIQIAERQLFEQHDAERNLADEVDVPQAVSRASAR